MIFHYLLLLLVKISTATFDVTIANYFQNITKILCLLHLIRKGVRFFLLRGEGFFFVVLVVHYETPTLNILAMIIVMKQRLIHVNESSTCLLKVKGI